MLRTRVLTAAVLACILLAGLFLLPPLWAVLAYGVVFTIGAWEWASLGALRGSSARIAYALCIALLMLLGWFGTADPMRLTVLLGVAVAWWVVAFLWLTLAPDRHQPTLALCCGAVVLVPAFIALARLQTTSGGF